MGIFYNENFDIMETYYSQMKYFIEEVLNNDTHYNDIEEAYKVLNICLNNENVK